MTTLTANSGAFSRALEVSEQARVVATGGYVQYTTASLVEANQKRAVWTTWPVGASAGEANSVGRMVIRLAGTSNGATCDVTDPRTLVLADAFVRNDVFDVPLLWALDDGTLYTAGNVLAGQL